MSEARANVSGIVAGEMGVAAAAALARKKVHIGFARFWAGASPEQLIDTILVDLKPYFEFEVSDAPRIVLYGPYPGGMPPGDYLKVFIGCENCRPIMRECDYAFGVLHDEYVGHPRYLRFARWGEDSHLIRRDKDWPAILGAKSRFCAFLYTNPVSYREEFCRALSRYKHVDAPGPSMNNMAGIDRVPGQRDWSAKVEFLRAYKFVIAFENASSPGYNTEKLTHAIEADCVPIYWGDPEIDRSFNTRRFINAHDFLPQPRRFMPRLPYAPHSITAGEQPTAVGRAFRKLNGVSSEIERRAWIARGFDALVDHIAKVDGDDALYLSYLREPLFVGNRPPDRAAWIARWKEIFGAA